MTDSFLVDTNIEVHSHPFVHVIVAVHEVVEVSSVEAYDHPNVVSVPMELDWADLNLNGTTKKNQLKIHQSLQPSMFIYQVIIQIQVYSMVLDYVPEVENVKVIHYLNHYCLVHL